MNEETVEPRGDTNMLNAKVHCAVVAASPLDVARGLPTLNFQIHPGERRYASTRASDRVLSWRV